CGAPASRTGARATSWTTSCRSAPAVSTHQATCSGSPLGRRRPRIAPSARPAPGTATDETRDPVVDRTRGSWCEPRERPVSGAFLPLERKDRVLAGQLLPSQSQPVDDTPELGTTAAVPGRQMRQA